MMNLFENEMSKANEIAKSREGRRSVVKRLVIKNILFLPLVVVELFLLALGWSLALPFPKAAKRLTEWSIKTLPGRDWYSL